jgi:hypothetical protein
LKTAEDAVTMYGMEDYFDEVVDGEAEDIVDAENREECDAAPGDLPTIADGQPPERRRAAAVPAVHAAAFAATGFVAGAAAAALVKRRNGRRLGRGSARTGLRRSAEGLPVISSHTYLVRVQVLGHPAE